ncbi:unnamed protein product [Ectocarpus sp. 12 AP-2014]
MDNNKKLAAEQVRDYAGTYDECKSRCDATMTFPRLIITLANGLTGDGEGQLEITRGKVYFKRDKFDSLKKWYNLNAKYNPADIGVVLNKTCVKIDGVVYTVESVEEGWYSLRNSNVEIEQWELLESRCSEDGGVSNSPVTLEEDLRKYIRSLLAWHELTYRWFVPFLKYGQTPQRGVQPVSTDGMLEDWSKRDLSSKERRLLECIANMRRLSRLAFINTSVEDTFHTLPVRDTREGDAGHEEGSFLRAFAGREGSLCQLNGLNGLREHDELRDENDGKFIIRMSRGEGDQHGAYPTHINYAMQLLQYSYRLNRPISFYEAYLPLCTGERKVLLRHFSCWRHNERRQDDFVVDPFRINGDPKKRTVAVRFSLERCREVLPNIPPGMIQVLSRDHEKYGTLLDKSNHTATFTNAAKALPLLKWVMQRDPGLGLEGSRPTEVALDQVYSQVGKFLKDKRNDAGNEDSRESGRQGIAKKVRKGRVPFAGFSTKECLAQVELLLEGMYINGMKRVLDAIDDIDDKCFGDNGWCYDILRTAEVASTSLKKKPVFTEKQLQGNEDQKKRIAAVAQGLKDRNITREHFELASAAAGVRDMVSAHPLRNQGFLFRRWANLSVNGRRESRNPGRMVAGLPEKHKLSKHGNGGGNGVAREHVIDVDCGHWYAVTNVIGRAFFTSFDVHRGELSPYIGPVDARGGVMSAKRFNGIVKKIGRAYLAVENLTIMQFRTACCTLVMSFSTALGIPMDSPIIKDFASGFLSSEKMMATKYNAHRAVTKQTRRFQLRYKGEVDFSGGAYGILKGAVKREIEMERGEKERSVEEGTGEGGGQLKEREQAVREREQAVKEREHAVREREQAVREHEKAVREREQAPKAKTGGDVCWRRLFRGERGSAAAAVRTASHQQDMFLHRPPAKGCWWIIDRRGR